MAALENDDKRIMAIARLACERRGGKWWSTDRDFDFHDLWYENVSCFILAAQAYDRGEVSEDYGNEGQPKAG